MAKTKKSAAGRKKVYNDDTKQIPFNLPLNLKNEATMLIKELRKLSMINKPSIDFNVIDKIFGR